MKQCETLYETIFSFRRVKSNQRRHASIYRDGIQVGRQAADEAQFVSLHALHKCATMHARETSHNTLHRLNEFWILRASRVPIVYRTHAFTLFNKHRAFTRPTDSIDFALISYLSILPFAITTSYLNFSIFGWDQLLTIVSLIFLSHFSGYQNFYDVILNNYPSFKHNFYIGSKNVDK